MKTTKLLATASISGVLVAGLITSPAAAWHPKGEIKKYVQNKTAQTALLDANTTEGAVMAKPGDQLRYVIEVKNIAAPAQKEYNDLYYTVVEDTLPAGIELASDPSKRKLTATLGHIKPGEKKSVEYIVTVTETTNGKVITNEACYEGNSKVHDNKQTGCDAAKTKVVVPPTPPVTAPQQPEPQPPKTPEKPAVVPAAAPVMPATGASSIALPAILASIAGYAVFLFGARRRAVRQEQEK